MMMMDCKRRFNKAFFLLITGIFIMLPIMGKAQDLPCDGTDPYTTCPLDSWVTVLVVLAGLFTPLHLHRKQKQVQA
jgi:hypothetical protein